MKAGAGIIDTGADHTPGMAGIPSSIFILSSTCIHEQDKEDHD